MGVIIKTQALLSPAGARVVTERTYKALRQEVLLSPAGARVVTFGTFAVGDFWKLLSPAGARSVTQLITASKPAMACCCPPQGRELLRYWFKTDNPKMCVAVPRRGAKCYLGNKHGNISLRSVAVPRRGAKCYGKNVKNTMRIFGIPTIFLYYLLYFCVSIRDIVGFLWCEPACNNLIYCYYNTRFAPNQPVSKPSSIATGCKTQRQKL